MGMKLFDDAGDDDVEEISKITINKDFEKRYQHNKKREDLQRFEEMKKKGLVEDSGGSDSESETESESDEDDMHSKKKDKKFWDALLKIRKKDPILKEKDAKLFTSSSDEEDDEDEDGRERDGVKKRKTGVEREKNKPKYLKDVIAQHLIEDGPEFEEGEEEGAKKKVKTYAEEQEDLRKEVLDAMAEEERENDGDGGDFLKVKERDGEEEEEYAKEHDMKVDEVFGKDEDLDENQLFLKNFFKGELWKDKDKGKRPVDDDLEEISDDEEIDRQEDYEREYNFRFEENASDRVLGHSRIVEGSVRKETNARKQQRERKKERMLQAEIERQEEVKRLKNLKKKEIHEKLDRIRKIAGIDGDSIPLTEDDLEEDFDPEEFDKKMKEAFGDDYYEAEDADPEFGSDIDEGESDLEKPDFEKEDELLGLPKDWDVIKSADGFFAERERRKANEVAKDEVANESDDDEQSQPEDEGGDDQLQLEEGKRKRKRKLSLKEKVALDKELEELYKLDYEDTIGDLKTRFKYRPVVPRKYGLKTVDILAMDEKELNQYVSLKKLAPYREKEWTVPRRQRLDIMTRRTMLLQGIMNGKRSQKRRKQTNGGDVGETSVDKVSSVDAKAEGDQSNNDESKLSRSAKKRHRQKGQKLPQSRLAAYGKIPSSSKKKSKK